MQKFHTTKELYDLSHKYFSYENGKLIRKITVSNNAKVGAEWGSKSHKGKGREHELRLVGWLDKQKCKVHQIIFLMHYGYMPKKPRTIDHIDKNPLNNKIENLRDADNYTQSTNKTTSRSSSGYKGVVVDRVSKGVKWWRAQASKDGKRYYYGAFKDPEAANRAAVEGRSNLEKGIFPIRSKAP